MTPEQQAAVEAIGSAGGLIAGIGLFVLLIYLVIWIGMAFCWAKLGERFGFTFSYGFVMSLVPIANLIFILQLAQKPLWWLILYIIPLVNIAVMVIVLLAICKRRQKPEWWAFMFLIPVVNLVFFIMLTLGKDEAIVTPS